MINWTQPCNWAEVEGERAPLHCLGPGHVVCAHAGLQRCRNPWKFSNQDGLCFIFWVYC